MKKQNKKGFSLLELVLVLCVGSMMAFMRFQDMKNEQDTVIAKAVGQQMKQMGEAVNGYINIRYDKLSTLTASSSQSSDPGPRTCDSSGCEITYQTLINEGLLPVSYTGVNAQKSSYKILLKRTGTTPNYVINGLITTTLPWSEGGKYRYDLLGKAMQEAGIDSGMTQSATVASGLQGAWKETSTDYSNINSAGLMAYRVGYDSAMYSVYLRRDGTLPMTGDLNLDGHNINNVAALNATGNITTTGDLQARNIKATGNIEAAKNVKGATLESTGRATVGEFIQLNGQATVGAACSPNGLQGRTAKGKILSCVNGVWTGSVQINNSQCKWFSPANAFSYFGEYSGQLHEKPIICPAGYIMTGSKMWGWAEDLDDEHVDIYCCPLS